MKNVTYIFKSGRKQKIEENLVEAKDFFYGLHFLDSLKYNIQIIEFKDNRNILSPLFFLFDRFMNKILNLPFYSSKLININNLKKLIKTDHLILVSESTICSIFPLLLILKRIFRIEVSLFVMGLYSKKLKFRALKPIHNGIIKVLILFVDNVFFLGEEELRLAKKIHRNENKLNHFPFSVDTEFWKSDKDINLGSNKKIIFVGNDGNRNFELLIKIAELLPEFEFVFVSKIPEINNSSLKNVNAINGQWDSKDVTDEDLKKLYSNSRFTILPLKESTQPSGQSVALQSMSIGIPVLISNTAGFWDRKNFKDNENIILIEENTPEYWVKEIKKAYNNLDLLNSISKNSYKLVNEKFDLINFNQKLLSYLK